MKNNKTIGDDEDDVDDDDNVHDDDDDDKDDRGDRINAMVDVTRTSMSTTKICPVYTQR